MASFNPPIQPAFFAPDSPQAKAHAAFAEAPVGDANISEDLVASAAAYESAKSYELYKESSGKPASHAQADTWLSTIMGGVVDKLVASKGLDAIDTAKVRREAQHQASEALKRKEF